MKKVNNLNKNLKEDIEFAKKTEEAWKRIKEGKYEKYSIEEFLKKLKKW